MDGNFMNCDSHKRVWLTILLNLCLITALSSVTVAEQSVCDPEVVGCGKAQAIAAQWDQAADDGAAQPREAMIDTDLLHVKADIELSSLNAGSDTCTVTGTIVMTLQSKTTSLSQFTFLLRDNYTISSLIVTDNTGPHTVTHSLVPNRTRVVTLNRTFGMDEIFTLTIVYSGNSVDVGMEAFSVSSAAGGGTVAASLSEPYYAYSWWPVKDGDVGVPGDNSDKFTMEMNITAPNNYVAPSNGTLLGVDTLSGSRKRYHWATNYPISTYLVSVAVSNYNTWTQTYNFPAGPYNGAGSMPVQFYIFPGNDSPTNRTAWEKCLNMLAVYRGIYGEYPFVNEKYGIYNFNFGGGMEHQTITGQGTFSESVTAHELGHQWWGDNITCKTWSDIWLNEGFADYTECLWEERKAGGINTSAYFTALNDRRPSSNGANDSVYVYDTSDVNRIFSSTYTYYKGGWVLHMLRHVVGDATFFNILAAYRQAYTGSAALTDNFAAIASSVSGKDLTPFFNQWIYQRGAPSYQYGWQTTNVAGQNYLLARINQTQTATAGSPPQVLDTYQMPVDLVATISGSPQTFVAQNTARTQWFVFPTSAATSALSFDPGPWILRGNATSVAYIAGPPKIVATSPTPGTTILQTSSPSQITVTFHTPVNAANANFSLVGDNTGAKSLTLVSGSNVNPAVLNLAGPLPPDDYTFTVTTGVTAANSGMALDGEITDPNSPGSLPSGDGLAGGNAVIRFAIEQVCNPVADIDDNCTHDQTDVDLFIQVLLGDDTDPGHVSRSDVNNSGTADGDDIAPFTAAYLAS